MFFIHIGTQAELQKLDDDPEQLNNDTEQLDNDTEPGTLEIAATDNNQQGCAGNVKNKVKAVKTKKPQPPAEVYTYIIIPLLKPCC